MISYDIHHLYIFGQQVSLWFFMIYIIAWPLILYYAVKELKRRKDIDINSMLQLLLFILLGVLFGSRVFAFFGPWGCHEGASLLGRFSLIFDTNTKGAVGFGAMTFAIIFALVFCRIKKISFLKYVDVLAPAIAFGLFFTKIGCFFAGCCFGTKTSAAWAIIKGSVPIHPTQLYDSFANLMIFLILLRLNEKREKEGRFDGYNILSFFMLYGAARFFTEFFRGDYAVKNYFFGFTTSQAISLVLFCTALIVFLALSSRRRPGKTSSRFRIMPRTYIILFLGGILADIGAYVSEPLPYLAAGLIAAGIIIFFFGLRSIYKIQHKTSAH